MKNATIFHRKTDMDTGLYHQERAEAGSLKAVIHVKFDGKGTITMGPHVMPFTKIAFPAQHMRSRLRDAVERANNGTSDTLRLEAKDVEGMAVALTNLIDQVTVPGAEWPPGTDEAAQREQNGYMTRWVEYSEDMGNLLAMFGETRLTL